MNYIILQRGSANIQKIFYKVGSTKRRTRSVGMETVGPTPDPTDKATCDHLQHSTANLAVLYSLHSLSTILCIVRKSFAGAVSQCNEEAYFEKQYC